MTNLILPDQTSLLELANALATIGLELTMTRNGITAIPMEPHPRAVIQSWLKAKANGTPAPNPQSP